MKRSAAPVLFFVFSIFLSGCSLEKLTEGENALFDTILDDAKVIKNDYAELAAFNDEHIERHANFISYVYDKTGKNAMVFMNRNYFWFKVAYSKNPVDAFDLQPPVLSVYMPQFKKYLKLRIFTQNLILKKQIVEIVYKNALAAGGTDPQLMTESAGTGQGPFSRRRRF